MGVHLLNFWEAPAPSFVMVTTTAEKIVELEESPYVLKAILPHQIPEALEWCDCVVVCVAPKKGADYQTTYLETAKLICDSIQNRSHPIYLVYTSSTSIYGQHQQEWIDETAPLLSTSEQAKVLMDTEALFLDANSDRVKVCILRLSGIYGPGRDLQQRARFLSGKEIAGRGESPTNHSHVDDIARAIEFAFRKKLKGVYNVVSDAHPTRNELYSGICTSLGLPPPRWNPKLTAQHGSNHCISNRKIKSAGFQFYHPNLD